MREFHVVTERLSLQLLPPTQAQQLAAYLLENRSHLARWEPFREESFFEVEYCARRLELALKNYSAGSALSLAMLGKLNGQLIGLCNFSNIIHGQFQACHLGYSIGAPWQGQGLMFEALTAAIRHVFGELGLHRIMANHLPENLRSARLLAALGFEKEGFARSYLKINGQWQDHVLNSLINPAHL